MAADEAEAEDEAAAAYSRGGVIPGGPVRVQLKHGERLLSPQECAELTRELGDDNGGS